MSTDEPERGEKQQAQFLVRAGEKLEEAAQCHDMGMVDPALASADTAAAFLEDYRKGPILAKDSAVEPNGREQ
jgi:hypothetical protein